MEEVLAVPRAPAEEVSRGRLTKALTVTLVLAVLALAIITALVKGWAASTAKEAEILYRRKRVLEKELGEISADVRKMKSPAEIDARIVSMKNGGKAPSKKGNGKN